MKKIISITVALAMIMATATTAFAYHGMDNVNPDGTEVSEAGHKSDGSVGWGYTDDGTNDQTPEASYGQSAVTRDDEDDEDNDTWGEWYYADDDDGDAADDDNDHADIYVWAKVSEASDKIIYKIDIEWGSMKFEFNRGTWDVETHTYGGNTVGWLETNGKPENDPGYVGYLDGVNNKIIVTNHSNYGIVAAFDYINDDISGGGTEFNADISGASNTDIVIGNFYGTNDGAVLGSKELTGTINALGNQFYDESVGVVDFDGTPLGTFDVAAAVNDEIEANILRSNIWSDGTASTWVPTTNVIKLPTAWKYNEGANPESPNLNPYGLGDFMNTAYNVNDNNARSESVYFAFSGTPDDNVTITDFAKVGVITVTIDTNVGEELNTPLAP